MKRPLPVSTSVRTKWTALVAVCEECSGGKRLAKALRRASKETGTRELRVVRSSCLDVCPKRGVTTATLRAGSTSVRVIDDALSGDAALAALG
jgi:predicted metal-binding protein